MTNVERLAQSKTSELLEDRDYLVKAINETIAEIAIGHITKNSKLSDLEHNQGYESAYDEVSDINKALRLQGFEIRNTKYINLLEIVDDIRF